VWIKNMWETADYLTRGKYLQKVLKLYIITIKNSSALLMGRQRIHNTFGAFRLAAMLMLPPGVSA
jgi:hypothetical protein